MDGMDGNGHLFAKNLVLSYTMSRDVTRCHAKEGTLRVQTAKNLFCLEQAAAVGHVIGIDPKKTKISLTVMGSTLFTSHSWFDRIVLEANLSVTSRGLSSFPVLHCNQICKPSCCCNISTMAKFTAVLSLLISGASAFVSQNGAAKPATALNAADGVWDPMVCFEDDMKRMSNEKDTLCIA